MADDLQYLVHFFHDRQYLFKTITMADDSQLDGICDTISSRKAWFWVRFSPGEREGYLQRRRFVERSMYEDYTRAWGSLKERVPVYFYVIPGLTDQEAVALARQRTLHGEAEPAVLMARLDEIDDTTNVTFTLDDSHTSYWRRIQEAGLGFGGEVRVPTVLPDHGRIFPIAMIERIHRAYRSHGIRYEVQIWDHRLLERVSWTTPTGAMAGAGPR
jgi:hypothetical protein